MNKNKDRKIENGKKLNCFLKKLNCFLNLASHQLKKVALGFIVRKLIGLLFCDGLDPDDFFEKLLSDFRSDE